MAQPLVSVVIPCYNQGRFLRDALDSVFRQSHDLVEAIVVDDGSTDDTAAVVRTFPAVRYLQQPNAGAPVARNTGLRASRGEYVIFLDADDRLVPDAIATGIEALASHPDWAFVSGHVRRIEADGSPAGVPSHDHVHSDPLLDLLHTNYIWTPGVVMYRRRVFDSRDAFDASAGGSADYELNVRLARLFPVGCHHRIVLECRRHGANMSADLRYMLKSAVSVRRAQRRYLGDNPAALQALNAGIAVVQSDFGARLVDQVKADMLAGRFVGAARGLSCLSRYYPAGVRQVGGAILTRAFAGRYWRRRPVRRG
jgi:glycosyltransferase involved in cell wall biosynthesis